MALPFHGLLPGDSTLLGAIYTAATRSEDEILQGPAPFLKKKPRERHLNKPREKTPRQKIKGQILSMANHVLD